MNPNHLARLVAVVLHARRWVAWQVSGAVLPDDHTIGPRGDVRKPPR
jgi:hypothetical protein